MANVAPGIIDADNHVADETVPAAEREILRGLAGRVAELASRPIEREKSRLWTALNDLRSQRPMVFCDPENGWNEIIRPQDLQCRSDFGRTWEHTLRREAFWGESMGDDRVIQPWFELGYVYARTNYGMSEQNIGGQDGGARTWISPLKDLDDLSSLRPQTFTIDREATWRWWSAKVFTRSTTRATTWARAVSAGPANCPRPDSTATRGRATCGFCWRARRRSACRRRCSRSSCWPTSCRSWNGSAWCATDAASRCIRGGRR